MNEVKSAALAAHAAGLCVVPPREDGSKAPIGAWKGYTRLRPAADELARWYGTPRTGLGIVTGGVSGNLEALDFDDRETYEAFREAAVATGLGDLVDRIEAGYLEETPSGGTHWLYRCERIGGNTKLARRPKREGERRHPDDRVKVLIETRGEGGFIVVAPSNGRVHESGRPYRLLRGGFGSIVTITPEEREALHALARTFDVMPKRTADPPRFEDPRDARPGDDFNRRAAWEAVLEPHGWARVYERGGITYWRRPGKDRGVSATTNFGGSDLLYVFSTSTPFEAERGYSKFSAYAILQHDADFQAAARALAQQGYGTSVSFVSSPPRRSDDSWGERHPLPEPERVPELPERLVPELLRPWLADVAERACIPLEFVAVPALVGAGAVVGRALTIRPVRYDHHLVVPNLWGAVVGRPGVMKSFAVQEALRPVAYLAATARERYRAETQGAAARGERLEAEIAGIKKEITRRAARGEPCDDLEREIAAKLRERDELQLAERRYLTNDATIEKLAELIHANPRGLLLVRDELAGWLRTLDRPGREGDREFYLESWNGTNDYHVDRIGRGSIHIEALTLSIIGGIQPGKLDAYIQEALADGAGADGLLQRFQLLVWPDQLPPWRQPERWPDSAARRAAADAFSWLDSLPSLLEREPALLPAEFREGDPPALRFDPEAQELYDAWRAELEGRLRSAVLAATPAFEAHLAKFRSLLPTLALLFHLVDTAAGGAGGPVSLEAARLAAAWCEFLEAHARKVYAAELTPGIEAAHALATKIAAGEVQDGATVRDLYRPQWAGLTTATAVRAGLRVLEAAGWLRVEELDTGGRPSELVRLHPELRGRGDA